MADGGWIVEEVVEDAGDEKEVADEEEPEEGHVAVEEEGHG